MDLAERTDAAKRICEYDEILHQGCCNNAGKNGERIIKSSFTGFTGKYHGNLLYKPALVVELKWDKSAQGAISQIKQKQYCKSLEEYEGNILLAGINYSKKDEEHQCMIEKIMK